MNKSLPQTFFLFFVLLITMAFFGLIEGFFMAIFWATVFAILFYGRYEKIKARFSGKSNLAAALTLCLILLMVIIPLMIISVAVINEATDVYGTLSKSEYTFQERVDGLQSRIPMAEGLLEKYGIDMANLEERLMKLLTTGTQVVAGKAVAFTQDIFGFVVNFFLMLYILFFFLRDGKRLVQQLIWVVPIGDEQEWTLLRRFESVARATVKGSLLVAIVQGIIGGLLFWALGIPSAFLWGVIMILTSLLPVGSALVWGPWAIALFIQGEVVKGIILVVIGAGFIGLIDNILRPRLVGQDTKMPDYLILISTLGGLAWFGLSGFVIGPVIAATFVTCWQMLGDRYGKPHDEVVTEPEVE